MSMSTLTSIYVTRSFVFSQLMHVLDSKKSRDINPTAGAVMLSIDSVKSETAPPSTSSRILSQHGERMEQSIQALLNEARRLQHATPAKFNWDDLCKIIHTRDLGALKRQPALEVLYTTRFNPLIKKKYGSTENYLKQRLGWKEETTNNGLSSGGSVDYQESPISSRKSMKLPYWVSDDEVQVRENDWSYAIPHNAIHYVVWTPLPLVHPELCSEGLEPTWSQVREKGVMGFTGETSKGGEHRNDNYNDRSGVSDRIFSSSKLLYEGFGDGPSGPGREIERFVKRRWEEEYFKTIWFVNPPNLQSVRGLAHFHVLVIEKEVENSKNKQVEAN